MYHLKNKQQNQVYQLFLQAVKAGYSLFIQKILQKLRLLSDDTTIETKEQGIMFIIFEILKTFNNKKKEITMLYIM